MPDQAVLKFGRTEAGYRLCLEGRGTMHESGWAEIFVDEVLADPTVAVVFDLSGCQYLDSTFLGCLLGMNSRHGPSRFRVATPPDLTRKLFGASKLDLVLKISADLPPVIGEYMVLRRDEMNSREIARHIMECHRRLAEIPGPQQNAFAAIAKQMARELETRG
ncbi:MAG TPA: STAS domain-containing protein [Tepidisphaeraceae bacterium]|nr:STAS domain-containing protein [Tepidisphaeraceae bacterium]